MIFKVHRQSPAIGVFVVKPRITDDKDDSISIFRDRDERIAIGGQDGCRRFRERERRDFFYKYLFRRPKNRVCRIDGDLAHRVVVIQNLELSILVKSDAENTGERVEFIKLGIRTVISHQNQYSAFFHPIGNRGDMFRSDKIRGGRLFFCIGIDDDINIRAIQFAAVGSADNVVNRAP